VEKKKKLKKNRVVYFYEYGLRTDYILADNFSMGYEAAMFLIEHGHKDIGFVGDIYATSSIGDRFFGYYKALFMNGLNYNKEWLICNNDAGTGIYTEDIILPDILPTAFVCHCERAAYFLKMTLESKGLKIPEDISLIAFDKTEISNSIFTTLTSFAIEQKDFAELALKSMLDKIEKKDKGSITKQYVSNTLIDRGSVKRI